nr:reverse transcriptase domain-containing protein [Tanacetum cinerariifolium]
MTHMIHYHHPTHEIPPVEVVPPANRILPAPFGVCHRRVTLVLLGQPFPYIRSYRYHPNVPIHMMTMRKRVGPLPIHRLAVRHLVDYYSSDHFTSDDSSRDSPPDSSLETSLDSSSDALFDSSFGHSSSNHSSPALPSGMRSSHQLCSSVPSSPHSSAAITERPSHSSSTRPSRKRSSPPPHLYRSSNFVKDLEVEINECITYADALRARGIDARVVVETVAREEVETSARGTVEDRDDRVTYPVVFDDIPEPSKEGAMEVNYEMLGNLGAVMSERINELERDNMRLKGMTMPNIRSRAKITCEVIDELIDRRVTEALEARDAVRNLKPQVEGGGEQEDEKMTIKEETTMEMEMEMVMGTEEEMVMGVTTMVSNEEDKIKRFIRGLPDNIQGNVIAAEPTRLQDEIQVANNLMDQKLKSYARNAKNKRRFDNNPRDNRHSKGKMLVVRMAVYREMWKLKDFPKLRNQNIRNKTRNKTRNNEATSRAYAIGGGGANPDSNVVTSTFLLNICYASMLFNSGAVRSFVSSTFSALLDVAPFTLDASYAIEFTDGRILETNVILRFYTLGLLGHPFDIDLMPIELGSFDVIIGMDWLAQYHAVVVCYKKIVRIPYKDEVLIIQGDDYDSKSKSKLSIISCTKTQKYIQKGCQVYLVQVTSKKADDKLKEKRLEDMPIV